MTLLSKKITTETRLLLLLAVMALSLLSCSEESSLGLGNTSAKIFTRFAFRNINKDTENFEDRLIEVRMLAFVKSGAQGGRCIYNGKLVFENNNLNNPSEIVSFASGDYDLIFIANESAYSGLPMKLSGINNIADFTNDPFYTSLPYMENFRPGEEAPNLFLMSAFYPDVSLPPGDEANPTKLYVSLVRAFSKIEIVINSDLVKGYKRITNIRYNNIPSLFTLPGADHLSVPSKTGALTSFDIPVHFSDEDYATWTGERKLVGTVVAYIPEFLRETTSSSNVPSVRISGVGIDPENIPLTINNDTETWNKISEMSVPELIQGSLNTQSVVRNLNYRITCLLTESVVEPNDITVYTEILPFEEVYIETSSYPGIVNVDRRVVELKNSYVGELYFNFKNADADASTYMEYVKSSSSPEATDDLGFTPVIEHEVFKLPLKFEKSSLALINRKFYLQFKNTKSTGGAADIIIEIDLDVVISI